MRRLLLALLLQLGVACGEATTPLCDLIVVLKPEATVAELNAVADEARRASHVATVEVTDKEEQYERYLALQKKFNDDLGGGPLTVADMSTSVRVRTNTRPAAHSLERGFDARSSVDQAIATCN